MTTLSLDRTKPRSRFELAGHGALDARPGSFNATVVLAEHWVRVHKQGVLSWHLGLTDEAGRDVGWYAPSGGLRPHGDLEVLGRTYRWHAERGAAYSLAGPEGGVARYETRWRRRRSPVLVTYAEGWIDDATLLIGCLLAKVTSERMEGGAQVTAMNAARGL